MQGWPALHERLSRADPEAAARINPNDKQRIQRALEVYESSGRTLTDWQKADAGGAPGDIDFLKIALLPGDRKLLHERIEKRLNTMINNGFINEVKVLHECDALTIRHPSMRSVGYRQLWQYLDGETSLEDATLRALAATRQLAKRQLTWLRGEQDLRTFDPLEGGTIDAISACLIDFFNA